MNLPRLPRESTPFGSTVQGMFGALPADGMIASVPGTRPGKPRRIDPDFRPVIAAHASDVGASRKTGVRWDGRETNGRGATRPTEHKTRSGFECYTIVSESALAQTRGRFGPFSLEHCDRHAPAGGGNRSCALSSS